MLIHNKIILLDTHKPQKVIKLQDKASVLLELRLQSIHSAGIAKYSASVKGQIGKKNSTLNLSNANTSQQSTASLLQSCGSITESTASLNLNEMKQDFKDVVCRRIMLDMHEAYSLQRVSVKLDIDFDAFLDL